MASRVFKTEAILGAYTGIVPPGGFAQIHEVLDHLFPGIMTVGCAMVSKSGVARREIDARLPQLNPYVKEHGKPNKDNFAEWFAKADEALGAELELAAASANQEALCSEAFAAWDIPEAQDGN